LLIIQKYSHVLLIVLSYLTDVVKSGTRVSRLIYLWNKNQVLCVFLNSIIF